MTMTTTPIKRALLSVSDKSGLIELAHELIAAGVEIISTGGTSQLLREANIAHAPVEAITGLAEMLDGRVKTLHPRIHGGILGKRDKHAAEAKQHDIPWIDLVVVNFYPFAQATRGKNLSFAEAVEYIDIGGPTMVRAAAKNFAWVGVVVDPADYSRLIQEMREQNGLTLATRQYLAQKVFALTADYDAMIQRYFQMHDQTQAESPDELRCTYKKSAELRYGENPHQKACAYQLDGEEKGILSAQQYQGKPLSYNNMLDAEAAFTCVSEFTAPTCVIVKHANPCGVASGDNIEEAYQRAFQADSTSAFGGIIALNQPCTQQLALAITQVFMEVVIAPAFNKEALALFASKPNLRILALPLHALSSWESRFIQGGILRQERDQQKITATDLTVVTQVQPTKQDIENMLFAWPVLKHIKSNGIVIAKQNTTIGIGAGQVSRIDAVEIAIRKAQLHFQDNLIQDSILASDAFFPFRDSIDRIATSGVKAIIQPGGSVRDQEVIDACNEHHIAMVFTGKRCFRH